MAGSETDARPNDSTYDTSNHDLVIAAEIFVRGNCRKDRQYRNDSEGKKKRDDGSQNPSEVPINDKGRPTRNQRKDNDIESHRVLLFGRHTIAERHFPVRKALVLLRSRRP